MLIKPGVNKAFDGYMDAINTEHPNYKKFLEWCQLLLPTPWKVFSFWGVFKCPGLPVLESRTQASLI